jgi:hypothetical protein
MKVIRYTPLLLSLIHERTKRAAEHRDAMTAEASSHLFMQLAPTEPV